jgi:nicotinic acetylcholine receptor
LMSILGFYFPPETGEKVTLEITILVACVFFLNIVSDMQPPSSNIPLISTYFTCVLIMVACSVVCFSIVLMTYNYVNFTTIPEH